MNIQIFKFCTFAYLSNIKINNSWVLKFIYQNWSLKFKICQTDWHLLTHSGAILDPTSASFHLLSIFLPWKEFVINLSTLCSVIKDNVISHNWNTALQRDWTNQPGHGKTTCQNSNWWNEVSMGETKITNRKKPRDNDQRHVTISTFSLDFSNLSNLNLNLKYNESQSS